MTRSNLLVLDFSDKTYIHVTPKDLKDPLIQLHTATYKLQLTRKYISERAMSYPSKSGEPGQASRPYS